MASLKSDFTVKLSVLASNKTGAAFKAIAGQLGKTIKGFTQLNTKAEKTNALLRETSTLLPPIIQRMEQMANVGRSASDSMAMGLKDAVKGMKPPKPPRMDEPFKQEGRKAGESFGDGVGEGARQSNAKFGEVARSIATNFGDMLKFHIAGRVVDFGIGKIQEGFAGLRNAFEQAKELQLSAVSNASTLEQLAKNLDYSGAENALNGLNKRLAKAAAALPGTTADYVSIAQGIQDNIVEAYSDPQGNLNVKGWEDAASKLATMYGVIQASTPGVTSDAVVATLSKAMGGTSSMAEMKQLDLFQKNPVLISKLEEAIKKEGGKELKDLTIDKRIAALTNAAEVMASKEFQERAGQTVEGLSQGFISSITDPSTGLFGLFRDLDESTVKVESAFEAINDIFKTALGEGGLFGSLGRLGKSLFGSVDPMKVFRSGLELFNKALQFLNDQVKLINRGLKAVTGKMNAGQQISTIAENWGKFIPLIGKFFKNIMVRVQAAIPAAQKFLSTAITTFFTTGLPTLMNGLSGLIVQGTNLVSGMATAVATVILGLDWDKILAGLWKGLTKVDWLQAANAFGRIILMATLASKTIVLAGVAGSSALAAVKGTLVSMVVSAGTFGASKLAGGMKIAFSVAAKEAAKTAAASPLMKGLGKLTLPLFAAVKAGFLKSAAFVALKFGVVTKGIGMLAIATKGVIVKFIGAPLMGLISKIGLSLSAALGKLLFASAAAGGILVAGAAAFYGTLKLMGNEHLLEELPQALANVGSLLKAQINHIWQVGVIEFNKARTSFISFYTNLHANFTRIWAQGKLAFISIRAAVTGFYGGIAQGISNVWNMASQKAAEIHAFGQSLIAAAIANFTSFYSGLFAAGVTLLSQAQSGIATIQSGVTGFFTGMSEGLQMIWGFVSQKWTEFTQVVETAASPIVVLITSFFQGIQNIFSQAKQALSSIANPISMITGNTAAPVMATPAAGAIATATSGSTTESKGDQSKSATVATTPSSTNAGSVSGFAAVTQAASQKIKGATASFSGAIPRMEGIFGAIANESMNKPAGSSLVVANSSEAVLRPEQLKSIMASSANAGANGVASQGGINLGGVTINISGVENPKAIAQQVIAEIEAQLRAHQGGMLA